MDTVIEAQYTLRSKDIPLIRFNLVSEIFRRGNIQDKSYSLDITHVSKETEQLFPFDLRNGRLSNKTLLAWISNRKAPKNRQFVNHVLDAIEDSRNPLRYVDVSHALSLNDAFWITNDYAPAKWDECNLYHHHFNELIAQIAFTGYGSYKVDGVVTSPELTSSGALKKCWSNRSDGIYLLKGDEVAQQYGFADRSQVVMEYYASQVAEALGLEHVPYDLENFHHSDGNREVVCKCKLFTSEDIGFVPAYIFFKDSNPDMENIPVDSLKMQDVMSEAFGRKEYEDMMIYDVLIGNRDRHLMNFGYLIDNNTGEYLEPAPIFDNGYSFFMGAARADLLPENMEQYIDQVECKFFDAETQTKYFLQKRHLKPIRSLLEFEFRNHPSCPIPNDFLQKMNFFVQHRARRTLEIAREIGLINQKVPKPRKHNGWGDPPHGGNR